MFTQGQVDRMNAALNVYRNSLLIATGCAGISAIVEPQQPTFAIKVACHENLLSISGIMSPSSMQVFDMTGRMILNQDCTNMNYEFNFPIGIYMYHLLEKTGNNQVFGKFIRY
jgi:hypothetical protein